MFYTMSFDGQDTHWEEHETLEAAERFAAEIAEEGMDCTVLETVRTLRAAPQPSLEQVYGVRPGIDFPATLY